jgi:hypothetical protein
VADAILDGPEVLGQFLGERYRVTDQTRDALPQRAMEALEVMGFAGMLRDGLVPLCRNHSGIGVVLIRTECGLRTVHPRDLGPQLLGTVTTAIAHVKRHDLARLGLHRNPEPWPIGLLRNKAPQLISFGFQLSKHHGCWPAW